MEAAARRCRDVDYPEVPASGVARLCTLGVEVFGRWSVDSIDVVRALAAERCLGLPERVREGTRLRLLRRWWGLLGMATQRLVAQAMTQSPGRADMPDTELDTLVGLADLSA